MGRMGDGKDGGDGEGEGWSYMLLTSATLRWFWEEEVEWVVARTLDQQSGQMSVRVESLTRQSGRKKDASEQE